MGNRGNILDSKKHGTNNSQMKWEDCAKDSEKALMVKGNIIEVTNTFFVIKFEDILKYRLNVICYTSVVCEVRPVEKDLNRTRITICGTNVCYPGDVGTNTASI